MTFPPPRWAAIAGSVLAALLIATAGVVAIVRHAGNHPSARLASPAPSASAAAPNSSPLPTPSDTAASPSPEAADGPTPSPGAITVVPNPSPSWQPAPGDRTPWGGYLQVAYDASAGDLLLWNIDLDSKGCYCQPVTWRWDGTGWHQVATGPSFMNRNLVYDADLKTVLDTDDSGGLYAWSGTAWIQQPGVVPTNSTTLPRLVYDSANHRLLLLLLGNRDIHSTTSVYSYAGGTWTELSSGGPAFPDDEPGTAFDAASGSVLVYGGCTQGQICPGGAPWLWKDDKWTQPATTVSPPGGFASITEDGQGLVTVLENNDGVTSWRWTGTDWQQLTYSNPPPVGFGPELTYDSAAGTLVLATRKAQSASSTWRLVNDAWTKIA